MASAGSTSASLALWLHLRRRAALAQVRDDLATPPPGEGPLILVHVSERVEDAPPLAGLIKAMMSRRPGLRFALTGAAPPEGLIGPDLRAVHMELPRDPITAQDVIDAFNPRALLLLGDQLPAALIHAMAEAGRPVLLAEARLVTYTRAGAWRGIINRGLMARIRHVLAPDGTAAAAARQLGAPPTASR